MDGEATEFMDWELLQSSDETSSVNSSESVDETQGFVGFEGDSEGMVRADYFSLDSQEKYSKTAVEEGEVGSVDSDNPSWIDPAGSEARYPRKDSGELWPDSGSERSDERVISESDQNYELGFVGNGKNLVGIEGISEIEMGEEKLGKPRSESSGIESGYLRGGSESEVSDGEKTEEGLVVAAELPSENQVAGVGDVKAAGEEERRSVVWLNWKLPIEILKYCAFRVSPVWSFSVAAAVMGFVILGRRLYKMKKKSQSLQLKVTLDDKKVSQFMTRTARLNEAFSIVKRVPVIRPSLPAAVGVTPWPIMSLR